MSTIAIIGGTGYAGGHIAAEAAARGHRIISISRTAPSAPRDGVEVRTGSIEDPALIGAAFADADVVVVAMHFTAGGRPYLIDFLPRLLASAAEHHTRLGIIGGAGSLAVAPGGPRVIDLPQFPDEWRPEAEAAARALDALRAADTAADWFYVSPPPYFAAHSPGERTGAYRLGDDVMVTDSQGHSSIGGADFALAVVDEIEKPTRHRARFTVGY